MFKIDDIDVNEILVSKEKSYGKKDWFKYLIGYNNDNHVIRSLHIILPQMTEHVKCLKVTRQCYLRLVITNC